MADINDNQVVETNQIEASQKAELDNLMARAGIIKPDAAATATQTTENTPPPPPAFSFDVFKEKYGWQAPEDAMTEIEQLRALKEQNADTTPVFEFENEESKKLFEAWSSGKTKEVYQYLSQQERLNELLSTEINRDTAAEIVKYDMQLKYKDLKPQEIDYMFKKQYSIPAKPIRSGDDDDQSYKEKVDSWQEVVDDKVMELTIKAKMVRPDLEQSKAKLVFPEIEQQENPEFINYRQAVEENERLSADAVRVYKTFTPESVETKINFNDEANGINLDFSYIPDPVTFGKTLEMVTDIDKFYDLFQKPDGTLDRQRFFKVINNAINMETMLKQAMIQSKNATLKSLLPDNSQSTGLVRQLNNVVEPSELDEQMARAGIKKGGTGR
jgi:hypothetical protein